MLISLHASNCNLFAYFSLDTWSKYVQYTVCVSIIHPHFHTKQMIILFLWKHLHIPILCKYFLETYMIILRGFSFDHPSFIRIHIFHMIYTWHPLCRHILIPHYLWIFIVGIPEPTTWPGPLHYGYGPPSLRCRFLRNAAPCHEGVSTDRGWVFPCDHSPY